MSKYDYLHALYQELKALDTDERDQIMRDIENRFKEAEEHGQDELSVTDSLGAPKEYASQYLEGITLELAGNVLMKQILNRIRNPDRNRNRQPSNDEV